MSQAIPNDLQSIEHLLQLLELDSKKEEKKIALVEVRNIDFFATAEAVKQFVRTNYGAIESFKFLERVAQVRTKRPKQNNGSAEIKFQNLEDATRFVRACATNSVCFMKRELRAFFLNDEAQFTIPVRNLQFGYMKNAEHFGILWELKNPFSQTTLALSTKCIDIQFSSIRLEFFLKDITLEFIKVGNRYEVYMSVLFPPRVYQVHSFKSEYRMDDFTENHCLKFSTTFYFEVSESDFPNLVHLSSNVPHKLIQRIDETKTLEKLVTLMTETTGEDQTLFDVYYHIAYLLSRCWITIDEGIALFQFEYTHPEVALSFFHHKIGAGKKIQNCLVELQKYLDNAINTKHTGDAKEVQVKVLATDEKQAQVEAGSSLFSNAASFQIYHVSLSPCAELFEGPFPEQGCRILQTYKEHAGHFLRVSFVDENQDPIYPRKEEQQLFAWIKRYLVDGFKFAGRRYEFLAFSSSQLRDHGCWFFHSTQGLTADKIRQDMGDLSSIKVPAKYAARMGQCFSTSLRATKLQPGAWKIIDDIERNSFCFSDGVGKISQTLAQEIANRCGISKQEEGVDGIPSAFQIRFGGAKGMVVVDPNLEKEHGVHLAIRKSMWKFHSPDHHLQVLRSSKDCRLGFLNQQIITILSHLGVSNDNFMQLQKEYLKQIDKINTTEAALEFMKSFSHSPVHQIIVGMLNSGFSLDDPFLQIMLHTFKNIARKDLKDRAHIGVPNTYSLFGVLDETGLLPAGKVFVQIRNPKNQILTGQMMIARSPALHPGDVRMVEAVDIPELHHLYNCVVFSQHGDRPLPSMLAGGDLDGDDYLISTDKRLFFPQNAEPMDYSVTKAAEVDQVKIPDIVQFFLDFMQNDILGRVASAHLAYADSDGLNHLYCVVLSKLHSVAVDFAKTGVPAAWPKELESPTAYPDFMQRVEKASYDSEKILGILFRSVQVLIPRPPKSKAAHDEKLLLPGYEEYLDEAEEYRVQFAEDLDRGMQMYSIVNTVEVISGHIILPKRKHNFRSLNGQQENIRFYYRDLVQRYRKYLMFVDRESESNSDWREHPYSASVLKRASAWYACTYANNNRNHIPSLAFTWIAYDVIGYIQKKGEVLHTLLTESAHHPAQQQVEQKEQGNS